jgi:hypothetical protein
MKVFYDNINNILEDTSHFFPDISFERVLATTPTLQLIIKSIDTEIKQKIYPYTSQVIKVETSTGIAIIDEQSY